MAVSQLRRFLDSVTQKGQLTDTAPRITQLVDLYNSNTAIDPAFKQDVFNIINASIELAEGMLDNTFPVEGLMTHYGNILVSGRNILEYVDRSRPVRVGFSIIHTGTGAISPGVFTTQTEADMYLQSLATMSYDAKAIYATYRVVPVRVTSQFALQPRVTLPVAVATEPTQVVELRQPGWAATDFGPIIPQQTDTPPAISIPESTAP